MMLRRLERVACGECGDTGVTFDAEDRRTYCNCTAGVDALHRATVRVLPPKEERR